MGVRVRRYLARHGWGILAVFIALGGSAYATTQLPANSVGTRQLRSHAVTLSKVSASARRSLRGQRGPRGLRGFHGVPGRPGTAGPNLLKTQNVIQDHAGPATELAPVCGSYTKRSSTSTLLINAEGTGYAGSANVTGSFFVTLDDANAHGTQFSSHLFFNQSGVHMSYPAISVAAVPTSAAPLPAATYSVCLDTVLGSDASDYYSATITEIG